MPMKQASAQKQAIHQEERLRPDLLHVVKAAKDHHVQASIKKHLQNVLIQKETKAVQILKRKPVKAEVHTLQRNRAVPTEIMKDLVPVKKDHSKKDRLPEEILLRNTETWQARAEVLLLRRNQAVRMMINQVDVQLLVKLQASVRL